MAPGRRVDHYVGDCDVTLQRPVIARPAFIDDDTVLSQYGRQVDGKPTFRSGPRADRETSQSMFVGPLTVEEISRRVMKRPAHADDRVRHCTVGQLRAAGFVVTLDPTARNGDHVAVSVSGDVVPWDDKTQEAFERCFNGKGS
jgi:hypothetical protein